MRTFININFKDKILQELANNSNKLFRNLKKKRSITEEKLKYFILLLNLKRQQI